MTAHTRIKINKVLGKDESKEMQFTYEKYKKGDPSISYEDFQKRFNSSLGFIFERTSINKLVHTSIEDYFKEKPENGLILKMLYDESQLLSHGNGYMLQSNTSAFVDSSSAIEFVDRTISYYLKKYLVYWEVYDELKGNHHNEKTIHDIKKCLKEVSNTGVLKDKTNIKHKNNMQNI